MSARVEIIHGDVAEVVRGLGANRFDAVLSDPPYGLRFMGRRWDYQVPRAEVWEAIGATCKPGAPLIAFGGTRTFHRAAIAIEDGGWFPEDTIAWLYGQGKPASAQRLKPAWEPAMLFRQPCDGTIAENIARWDGVGGLAIDACRIEWGEGDLANTVKKLGRRLDGTAMPTTRQAHGEMGAVTYDPKTGRWPANVVLDEGAAAMLDAQSGVLVSHGHTTPAMRGMGYQGNASGRPLAPITTSIGGASRFFYCAKVKGDEAFGNEHPTRKPEKLTSYLARLIRPERGGVLLVPFCGSGSEIIGAILAGWSEIIGIEIEEKTVAFARERIDAELSGTSVKDARNGQPGLF